MTALQSSRLMASFWIVAVFLASETEARDWQAQTESGQKLAAHAYCSGMKQATCTETPLPKIEITAPPGGGTISFENTMQNNVFTRVGEVRTGKKCPVVPRHCVQIYYTPAPGYQGPDRFSYTVSNSDGQKWHDTITVDVHEHSN
jgi:Big-like domain-containing protein